MRMGDPPADGEPEPAPLRMNLAGGVGAIEAVEDFGEIFFRNADSGVGDADARMCPLPREGDHDSSFRRGITDGVFNEVEEEFPQPIGIAGNGCLFPAVKAERKRFFMREVSLCLIASMTSLVNSSLVR